MTAYGSIPTSREPNHSVATTHGLRNAVVGSLFITSDVLRSRDHAAGRRTGALARLLALTGGALSLHTAWLGGKLIEEYGEAVQPVMEQPQDDDGEDQGDDDHARGRERLDESASLGLHQESSTQRER